MPKPRASARAVQECVKRGVTAAPPSPLLLLPRPPPPPTPPAAARAPSVRKSADKRGAREGSRTLGVRRGGTGRAQQGEHARPNSSTRVPSSVNALLANREQKGNRTRRHATRPQRRSAIPAIGRADTLAEESSYDATANAFHLRFGAPGDECWGRGGRMRGGGMGAGVGGGDWGAKTEGEAGGRPRQLWGATASLPPPHTHTHPLYTANSNGNWKITAKNTKSSWRRAS
ncbi:unnamed protein product [Lampetra fluviatilis]